MQQTPGTTSLPSPSFAAVAETCISYEIERQVSLDYGLIEVGKFAWSAPVDAQLNQLDDRISFNLALSPRPMNGFLSTTDAFGREHRRKLERIMLINPGDTYRMSLPPGQVRAMYCSIHKHEIENLLDQPIELGNEDWQAHTRPRMPVIGLLLNRIYEELRDDNYASAAALEAYASALRIELVRCLRISREEQALIRKGGLAPWRQRLVRDRIYADAPAPRLPELADLCGMTVRQLSRAFKEETGKTIGGQIIEATIERAVTMLLESEMSIAEISAELGFASPASFTYAFRRSAGVQPSELRKRANA